MVEVEELPDEEPTSTTSPTTTTKDADGWEELMGNDLIMKVNTTQGFPAGAAGGEVGLECDVSHFMVYCLVFLAVPNTSLTPSFSVTLTIGYILYRLLINQNQPEARVPKRFNPKMPS